MTISSKWFNGLLTILVTLIVLVGCKPAGDLVLDPQTGALASVVQTPIAAPLSPLMTPTINPEDIEPTPAPPSPTLPPVPTPLPTPAVTPIPVAKPPFILEVVGKAQQPFWIIYWKDNQVWRVDDQGKQRELLLDTYKSLGQYLTDIPDPYKNTDCCWIGPRVVVSPDGTKLALVVVDKINGTKNDHFTFSIYAFDIKSGDLKFISEGEQPLWSPDNHHIAFLKQGILWVGDLESGAVKEHAKGDPSKPEQRVWEMTWSPDGKKLAYLLGESMRTNPEFWIINIDNSSPAQLLLPSTLYARSGLSWSPDGQQIFYWSDNLWAVSVATGDTKQLTQGMTVGGWNWSPDGRWLALSATREYESPLYLYDTWLLSADGRQFIRVTFAPPEYRGGYWSPDGTRLFFTSDDSMTAHILALDNGVLSTFSSGFDAVGDFAIGGIK
jgi:dipeptidyl aminopeptidase/acylaminoacyl peptidase